MGKKNPYITTIGFNKEDPEHVRTAEILNAMGRGKASYIVKAVICYESIKEKGEFTSTKWGADVDYGRLRSFVLQVITEHEGNPIPALKVEQPNQEYKLNQTEAENVTAQMGLDEFAIEDILLSMEAFRG